MSDDLIPILTVRANGGQQVFMEPVGNDLYRVTFGNTFAGEIKRYAPDEWRIARAFVSDSDLGSRLEPVAPDQGEAYVLADDAAYVLIEQFGYSPERCQTTFREAVTYDLDLPDERKQELIAMCDAEGLP